MAITPLPSLDRTSAAFKANVDTFFGAQLPAFSIEAEAARAEVVDRQEQAATSATNAATSEGNALAYRNTASTAAGDALTARNLAQSAQNAAELALDSFDDRYLGAKATAPTLDNDGAAILPGALYWDTVLNGGCMRVRQAGAWVTIPANVASAITNTPAGNIAATTVQAALNELDTEKVATTAVIAITKGGTGATTANAAADALGSFRRGTVLGSVSQASGIPTGAVIERGSNANGEYVRFADGTQICTNAYSGGLALSAYSGAISRGVYTWAYPAAFAGGSGPTLTGSGGDQAGNGFAGAGTVGAAQGELVYFTASPVVTASSIRAMVIGRWF